MGWGTPPVSGAQRSIARALAILPALAGPAGALARQATPEAAPELAARQEIVFFCGLQNGIGLDRQMTRAELDLYFADGLPSNSWQPAERGCAGDAPCVLFDGNGFFLGFTDQAAAQEPLATELPRENIPVEDPADAFPDLPTTDEPAGEPDAAPDDQPADDGAPGEPGATDATAPELCAQGMELPDPSSPMGLPPDMPVFGGL